MPATSNKGYATPTPGTESGTWGGKLNDEVFTYVDTNLGGVLPVSLSSSNVSLTTAEARNVALSCSGTLSANVQITNPAVGFYFVENLCTGAFTVTVTNGVGSAVTIPQGYRLTIFADATNGARAVTIGSVANSSVEPFPAGTTALFLQAAVPTGWTLSTGYVDYALKLSSSAGGVPDGNVAMSTLFARTAVDGHALTTNEIPSHSHSLTLVSTRFEGGFTANPQWMALTGTIGNAVGTSSTTGGGEAHDHSLELRARRVGVLIGVRNT